jgi:hypothetical protein
MRGHHPFFSHLAGGFLGQLRALQCPWTWGMHITLSQVLCPSLAHAVLDFRNCTSKTVGHPPLPLGRNLHTLSLTWVTPHCLPLHAFCEILIANAPTLRLLRALPAVYWPELQQEVTRLLPILENLERLRVDITVVNGDFTALQSLIENMPKSYQMLEMMDMHSSADTCSKLVDLLAAAPRTKPKELVVHGIEVIHIG